jgi:hypothetical protein
MWAQLISARLKPGQEDGLARLWEQLQAAEAADSGLVRSTAMHDQADPLQVHFLVVFESEEKARARESDTARQERLLPARETMAEIFDGPPQFTDLVVVRET